MNLDGYEHLRIDVDAGVAFVTIAHPPLNVLAPRLMKELGRFVADVRVEPSVRVVVVRSADPEFFLAHGDMNIVNDPSEFLALTTKEDEAAGINPMQALHEHLRTLPQVTIAQLAGFARGGGVELAMALDMRFAAIGKAGLSHPEARMGIIPGAGGTQYLPRLTGRARALEIILGGALFDAALAERYGWVNRALPADELDAFVDGLARRIAALPPGVAAAAKRSVDGAVGPLPAGLAQENKLIFELFATPAATAKTHAALREGAQTREGERDLEAILDRI